MPFRMRLLAFLLSLCTLISTSTSTSAAPIPIPYNGSYISLPTTDISFTHTIKHFPIWGTLYQVNQDGTPDLSSPILPSTTPPINVFSWITWIRSATSQTSFCQCSDSSPLSPCELSCTNDSYHVTQLLGEPDVYPEYGTNSHAWAPSGNYTADVLELGIAYPMYVSGIETYETYHPQPITRITTTLHNTSTWYNLWSGSSPSSSTSRIFRPPFCHTRFASDIIRLEVTSVNGTRPEIDAIRVLGTLTLPPGRVRSTQGLVYYVPVQGIESSNFTDFLTYTTFNCTSTSSPSAPVTFQLIPPSTPTYFMTQLYHIVNTRSTIIPINITSVLTDVTTRLKTSLTRDNITIVIHEITGGIRITSPNTTSIVFTTGSTITTSSIAITAGRTASIVTLELRYIITTNDNTYTYRIRYLLCASSYYPLDNQCIACTSIAPSTSAMSAFEYDDFVRYCVAYTSISQGLRIAIYVITAICMAMTVGVIAAVVWYRAHPVIVWSSYKFCLLMLAGCLLVYTHVFLTAAEPSDESCAALPWIGHFSYCLIASCLFSKTYRLYRILNNKDLSSHAMKDWELFLMIAIITGVMGIYLIIWQLIDPLRAITDIYMGTATVTCSSNHSAWTIAALAFDIALLVWGVTLVWKTRKLPDQYNEGRYIAVVIIGVVVIGLISIPIIYFLSASHTAILVVKVIAFLSATTLGVCTIFIPKFYQIYTRPTPVIDPQASRVIEFSSADQSRAALHHVPEAEFPFSNIGADHGLPSIHLREIPVPSELNPFSHPDLDHAMPTHILVKDEDEHKMPASRRPSVARSDISIPVPVPVPVPVPAPITRTHRVFSSSDVDSANPFSNPENDHGLPTSVVEHYHERANRWLEEKSVQPFSHAFLDHGIITPQHHRGRSHDAIATSSSPRPAHHNRYQSQQLLPSNYADSHMSHSPSPIDPTDIFSSIVNDHGVDEEILLEHQARTRAEIEAAHQLEHGKHLILADAIATQQATEEDYQPLNIFSSIDADHGVDDPVLSRTLQQRRASITRSQANSRVASRAVSHQGSPTHRDIPQFTFQVPSVVRPHPRSAMHSRTASQPANVFSDPDAAHDPEWIIERRLIQDGHETATHTVPLSRQHMTQAQIESLNPFSDVDADHAIPADIVERVKQTRSGRSSALSSARTSPHASQARRLPTTTSSHVVNLRLARPGLSASIPSSPTASELGSSNHIPVPYHSTRSSIAHLIGTGHVSGMDKLEVPDVLDDRRASIGSFASLGSTRSLFDVPTDLERRGVSNFGSTSPSGRYASGTRSPTSAIDDQPASPDPTSPVHISHPPPAGYIPTIPESDTQALAGSIQALLRARQSRNSSRPASPIRSNIGSESPSPRPLQIHLPPSDMEYQDIDDDSALAAIMGMGSPRSRPSSPPLLSSPRGRERINTLSLEPSDEIKHK